ncbi:SpoIIE family protein phosphatase [Thermodesulfobacteriota bacterium]
MRYRWKMLILLMAIAMIPIMAMRTFGVKATRQLANELVSRAQETRINNIQNRMRLLVSSYASVLRAGREQIEMALMLQAWEVERCLAKQVPPPEKVYFAEDFNSGRDLPNDTTLSSVHFRSRPGETFDLLNISYSQQVFKLAPGVTQVEVDEDIARLTTLTPIYKKLSDRLQGRIYWQYTSLANGLHSAYPGHNAIPRRLDPREQRWYQTALETEAPWSDPYVDPETRQIVVAATTPIKRPDGEIAGVTALIIPVSSLFDHGVLFKNIPPETLTFMIYLSKQTETGEKGARIVARDEHIDIKHRHWRAQIASEWLISTDKKQFQALLDDLETGISQTRQMSYQGKVCLWVYGAVHSEAALVLITPYEEILKPARQVKEYLEGRIDNLLRVTRLGSYGIILLVVILAFSFSRTVTKPIQALAAGAKRLAAGQFDSRVDIRSRDEFGDMGAVFNNVGPQLKERYQMRHSLTLAKEVQQNLLPQAAPIISGLDIAGESIYCDETGGDYYDFMNIEDAPGKISIVVGDVSDHGIPSALLMTTARAFLRQRSALPGSIQGIVTDVNFHLARDVEESGRFMTLFYCNIDLSNYTICWVCAGHDPAIFFDPVKGTFHKLAGKGLPLGVFDNTAYQESRQDIAPGQVIVIGTDGIWETVGSDGEMFGKERLRQVVRSHADESAKEIIKAVIASVNQFCAPRKPDDDLTLVIVKIT